MDTQEVIQSIITLFSEAYAGPADPKSTWFIDNDPDSGILGLVRGISAAEASWSTKDDQPGTSVAAHVEHLRWSLANANRALEGEPYNGSWKESWNTLSADEAAWERLRNELKREYETLVKNLQKQRDLPGDYLTGVMALLPHAAYHLGTIRQQIERLRAFKKEVSAM
ncbi:MAG TPA: DinB family protein [Anaerolineales bacterium]